MLCCFAGMMTKLLEEKKVESEEELWLWTRILKQQSAHEEKVVEVR